MMVYSRVALSAAYKPMFPHPVLLSTVTASASLLKTVWRYVLAGSPVV